MVGGVFWIVSSWEEDHKDQKDHKEHKEYKDHKDPPEVGAEVVGQGRQEA